jgi:hypothetical protein
VRWKRKLGYERTLMKEAGVKDVGLTQKIGWDGVPDMYVGIRISSVCCWSNWNGKLVSIRIGYTHEWGEAQRVSE